MQGETPVISRTHLALLSQSVEEADSKPVQSEFESLEGHWQVAQMQVGAKGRD